MRMELRLETHHSDGQQRRRGGRERKWGYGLGSEVELEVCRGVGMGGVHKGWD